MTQVPPAPPTVSLLTKPKGSSMTATWWVEGGQGTRGNQGMHGAADAAKEQLDGSHLCMPGGDQGVHEGRVGDGQAVKACMVLLTRLKSSSITAADSWIQVQPRKTWEHRLLRAAPNSGTQMYCRNCCCCCCPQAAACTPSTYAHSCLQPSHLLAVHARSQAGGAHTTRTRANRHLQPG